MLAGPEYDVRSSQSSCFSARQSRTFVRTATCRCDKARASKPLNRGCRFGRCGFLLEQPTLMQPLLGAPIDSIGVGQEHDPLPRRKAPHVDPGSVALRDLVQIEMLVFLRFEIELRLRTPETGHVLCDVSAGDPGRKHEGNHESGIDDLSE